MSDERAALRTTFDDEGYDVREVTVNRDLVRVVLSETVEAGEALSVVTDALGDEPSLGVDVATESVDGHDGTSTVVSFRNR